MGISFISIKFPYEQLHRRYNNNYFNLQLFRLLYYHHELISSNILSHLFTYSMHTLLYSIQHAISVATSKHVPPHPPIFPPSTSSPISLTPYYNL